MTLALIVHPDQTAPEMQSLFPKVAHDMPDVD